MDKFALVEEQIRDGQQLVSRLTREGFAVTGAGWVDASEGDRWLLYIASPVVKKQGPLKAYRRALGVIRKMPEPFWVEPTEVKLISPKSPLAEAVREIARGSRGKIPVRYRGARLGDVSIDAALIYPPTDAADGQEVLGPEPG